MRIARFTRLVFASIAALALLQALPAGAQRQGLRNFDHLRTGFPLTGAHAVTPCETCHIGGQMAGTPKNCDYCHRAGSRIAATVMPLRHIVTTEPCDNCHRSAISWTGARFSHVAVAPGTCQTCHNGGTAAAKPAGHVATTSSCDQCHRTIAWVPAGFNHVGVLPGTCTNCHGVSATGKPATHMPTTSSCDACHRTTAWKPSYYNHSGVAPGTCTTCHNGVTATGLPGGHMVTTRSCDACHTTAGWLPATAYTHLSPNWKPHNSSVTCFSCHTTRTEQATWSYPAYTPACAGCHAGRFKPDSHKKTEVPTTILYTVSELRDCSGSCHEYTDNTFTVIRRSRTGEHRSTSSGF
jgi:hypothetical protein